MSDNFDENEQNKNFVGDTTDLNSIDKEDFKDYTGNEQILNFGPGSTGFSDKTGGENERTSSSKSNLIHIRIQQRTTRKVVTTVQGIPDELELKKIVRHLRKSFSCLGTVVAHSEYGEVVQLSGDQREKVAQFLTDDLGIPSEQIKVHGF